MLKFVFFSANFVLPYILEQKICPKCWLKKEEFMRTLEEYFHMMNTDENTWNIILLTILVILVLLLIYKTKDREWVRFDRYVHVLKAVLDFSDILGNWCKFSLLKKIISPNFLELIFFFHFCRGFKCK